MLDKNVSEWNEQREKAVQLVANGELRDQEIANTLGITIRTLRRWRADAAFRMRVESLLEAVAEKTSGFAIASKSRRIEVLDQLLNGILQVKAERATAPKCSQRQAERPARWSVR